MYKKTKFYLAGDKCLVAEFGNEISESINNMVRNIKVSFERESVAGITELIPTYRSLLIYYDPFSITVDELTEKITELQSNINKLNLPSSKLIYIPTFYGGELGPDLDYVAASNGITTEEVIEIHLSSNYLIYMLGFTPGFCYLGGMSEKIATPRLKKPRLKIPAGSVGIAANQTGIYPVESPGGWQLIGRTPLCLYNPYRDKPVLLEAGNYLKFYSISASEYASISKDVEAGVFQLETSEVHADEGN